MVRVTIDGKEYGLRFDLYAMEQIEDEFGSVKAAFDAVKGGKQLKSTRALFRILCNSFLSYQGQEESITGDEIKHAGMDTIRLISEAVRQAVEDGSKSETTGGGAADDSVHDIFLEEIEKKS